MNKNPNERFRIDYSAKDGRQPTVCFWCGLPFFMKPVSLNPNAKTGRVHALSPTKEHLFAAVDTWKTKRLAPHNIVWAHAGCNHARIHASWLPHYMEGPPEFNQFKTKARMSILVLGLVGGKAKGFETTEEVLESCKRYLYKVKGQWKVQYQHKN